MEYLGAWGTLIHEKKLRSKISCQTPFNVPFFPKEIYENCRKTSDNLYLKKSGRN